MAQQGMGNVNQTLLYPGNATQARSRKIKRGTWRGTLIHALEKRLREREKKKTALEGLGPLIYWTLPFVGLHPCPFFLVPRRSHSKCPCSICVHAKTKEESQQKSKETNGRRSILKEKLAKDAKRGQTSMWYTRRSKGAYYHTKRGVLGGQI